MSEFELRVRAVVANLRPGEIATYGEVAEEAGYAGAARAVGTVLAVSEGLPWWRVVAANGRLVPGHEREHAKRLRAEGVQVAGGRVRQSGPETFSSRSPRRSSRLGPVRRRDPGRLRAGPGADGGDPSTDRG